MDLRQLGFEFWERNIGPIQMDEGCVPARVIAVDRGQCAVHDGIREVSAEPSGRLCYAVDDPAELPCVGDYVAIRRYNGGSAAIIEKVLPRRTFLRRRAAGSVSRVQMIAANVDVAFIVQACGYDFNPNRLERALVLALEGGVQPAALLAKADLAEPAELAQMLTEVQRITGAPAIAFSNVTGDGLDAVLQHIGPERTCCLLGSSGVGKTTLMNRLAGRELFRTAAVSATGEGTHTTTRRQLLMLENGGLLIDTPGMREFGLAVGEVGVGAAFDRFAQLAAACRFADCSHTTEPGCAVLAALACGELSRKRYENYLKLQKEAQHTASSVHQRRMKERAFSRHVKASKKIMEK
ncbi:ribosome biogenesis GTPase [Humidesulfovibrio mexicanus]|uniref:Small ribosomal subunit biogenesis GTPase RsgA n=1 Tax=Humidesulfovibrio mexicanus TaxID=147047 RepID=A0A238XTP5_9BACT|nr:ribosome small subunit-dependent GTPase A [Humidesulfovibrio mexicanus]SNR62082.1 ribosome biogenesis GTPase [Humidesulfovibrio mexicanus]